MIERDDFIAVWCKLYKKRSGRDGQRSKGRDTSGRICELKRTI